MLDSIHFTHGYFGTNRYIGEFTFSKIGLDPLARKKALSIEFEMSKNLH